MRGLLFLTLLAMGSLVALTGLRQFFMQPLESTVPNLIWFGLQLLPLLLPLPGVLQMKLRATFMLCLCSTLYFIHGVYIAVDPQLLVLGAFEIGFSLMLCAVTAIMVRQMRESEAAQQVSE